MDFDLLDYCLTNKILPLCLPAHTSHILQPLDVSIFSPMGTYYAQEVNKLRVPVDKDQFPNLIAHAHVKGFSKANIRAGFRASGIYPYNPAIILDTLSLPEPTLLPQDPSPPVVPCLQTPADLITFQPRTPKTPHSIHNVYVERLSAITSNSPTSIKLRSVLTKLKRSAEPNAANVVMHEAGEAYLREEIPQITAKGKADRRHLNSDTACLLERGEVLAELKRKRDEKDAATRQRKQRKRVTPSCAVSTSTQNVTLLAEGEETVGNRSISGAGGGDGSLVPGNLQFFHVNFD